MYGLPNERARELIEEKKLEAKMLASRPESERVSAPAAHLSPRAWLLIALGGAAIVMTILFAVVL